MFSLQWVSTVTVSILVISSSPYSLIMCVWIWKVLSESKHIRVKPALYGFGWENCDYPDWECLTKLVSLFILEVYLYCWDICMFPSAWDATSDWDLALALCLYTCFITKVPNYSQCHSTPFSWLTSREWLMWGMLTFTAWCDGSSEVVFIQNCRDIYENERA